MAEPGLTLCLAAYRYDARPLLQSLSPALARLAFTVRILLGDDASGQPWSGAYQDLQTAFGIELIRPDGNLGRAGIRNLLASQATTDWLLFLDVDSLIISPDFLQKYWQKAQEGVWDFIQGGTLYTPDQPGAGNLRHRYGMAREMGFGHKKGLALNNLLIHKEAFVRAGGLDATIRTYGHEDTLLGKALISTGAKGCAIDNPVLHTGLEDDPTFLAKSLEAARGLALLYKKGKVGPEDARLIAMAERIRRWGARRVPGLLAPLFSPTSLRGLDVRKLAAFLEAL